MQTTFTTFNPQEIPNQKDNQKMISKEDPILKY